MPKPTLGYWKIRGYCQPLRHLLAYAGVDYQEKTYIDGEKWFSEKFTLGLDFPNIPYWIDGEVKLTEYKAILKYLTRKYAPTLIPKDNVALTKCEMVESVAQDIWNILIDFCYVNTDEIKAGFPEKSAFKLKELSVFFGESKFSSGDKLTYVDFMMYEVLYHYNSMSKSHLKDFPNLLKFMKNVESLPEIAKYMATPAYLKGPCFSPSIKVTPF